MWCGEITVRLDNLKKASTDTETRPHGNCAVIWYALCSVKVLVNKWRYRNIQCLTLKYMPFTACTRIRSPFVHDMPQRAQSSSRTSFGIRVELRESCIDFTFCVLFVSQV